VGKGEAEGATPSPLSRWSQFSIFTGVRLSRSGRPQKQCPKGEASSSRVFMGQQQNWVRLNSPSCASLRLGIR
jgi:hypothetical protein